MAERFVSGFAIDPDELVALVGSKRAASEIVSAAGEIDDVDELLSEWAPDDPLTSEQAIAAITAGTLDPDRAYEYRRALELVAAALGERLGDEIEVVSTYYLPNESHGRWNPVLAELGLTALAREWGTSHGFPWGADESRVDWPIATLLRRDDVTTILAELEKSKGAVSEVPAELLADGPDPERATDAREELARGLEILAGWLTHAAAAKLGLLLMMDGSQ